MVYLTVDMINKEISENIKEYIDIKISEGRKFERLKKNELDRKHLKLKIEIIKAYAPLKIEEINFVKKEECDEHIKFIYKKIVNAKHRIDGMTNNSYYKNGNVYIRSLNLSRKYYAKIIFSKEEK